MRLDTNVRLDRSEPPGPLPQTTPAERIKMREALIVPLAQQSVDILKALVLITGRQ
jgi:hypothetical protein